MEVKFRGLFFLVLAATLIHAQATPATTALFQQLPLVLPAVITLVVIVLAGSYMASESFHAPQLGAWVKTELRELIVAGILFVAVMALIASANIWITMLTGISGDYKATSKIAINDMQTRSVNAYHELIRAYYLIGMRTGFSASISGGYYLMLSASNAPFTGYAPFFTFMGQAAGGLSSIIFLYRSLDVFLDFFSRIGGTLIYVAFAFRFIPFTRNIGSTMVALIVGMYLIFPFSLILINYMHTNIVASSMPAPDISAEAFSGMEFSIPPGARYMCGQGAEGTAVRFMLSTFGEIGFSLPPCILVALATWGAGFGACYYLLAYVVYPILTNLILPLTWLAIVGPSVWASIDVGPVYDALQPFFQNVNNLVVLSYVDAIIAGLITMTGIRSLSLALGGEYLIPGVQKLI